LFDVTKFNWADAVVFAVCELVAIPMCDAGWHGIVSGEYVFNGVLANLAGLPIGVAGISFHWWKDKIPPPSREWIQRQANRWWPAAFLIFFLYVTGPEMYRRATKPVAISGAIGVMTIGGGQTSIPAAPVDAPRVYTNKTIHQLKATYESRTSLQADILIAEEKGKWIDTEGTFIDLHADGLVALENEHRDLFVCHFGSQWISKLTAYHRGETIKIRGKFEYVLDKSLVALTECELYD